MEQLSTALGAGTAIPQPQNSPCKDEIRAELQTHPWLAREEQGEARATSGNGAEIRFPQSSAGNSAQKKV